MRFLLLFFIASTLFHIPLHAQKLPPNFAVKTGAENTGLTPLVSGVCGDMYIVVQGSITGFGVMVLEIQTFTKDFHHIGEEKLKLKQGSVALKDIAVYIVGEYIHCLALDQYSDNSNATVYDFIINPVDFSFEQKPIMNFKSTRFSNFNFESAKSQNEKFIGFIKDSTDIFVITNKGELAWSAELENTDRKDIKVGQLLISNTGDAHFVKSSFTKKWAFLNLANQDCKTEIISFFDKGKTSKSIELAGTDFKINRVSVDLRPDGILNCAGFFIEPLKNGFTGIVFLEIDPLKSIVIHEQYSDIPDKTWDNLITSPKIKHNATDTILTEVKLSEIKYQSDSNWVVIADVYGYTKVNPLLGDDAIQYRGWMLITGNATTESFKIGSVPHLFYEDKYFYCAGKSVHVLMNDFTGNVYIKTFNELNEAESLHDNNVVEVIMDAQGNMEKKLFCDDGHPPYNLRKSGCSQLKENLLLLYFDSYAAYRIGTLTTE